MAQMDASAELQTLNERLETFRLWPKRLEIVPQNLAEAGFFFTGFTDCVKCFNCGVKLYDWRTGDDPWVEHAKGNNECRFLLKEMGTTFTSKVTELAKTYDQISYAVVLDACTPAQIVAHFLEIRTVYHYHTVEARCTDAQCDGCIPNSLTRENLKDHTKRLGSLSTRHRLSHQMKHMIADAGYVYSTVDRCFYCFFCNDKKVAFKDSDIPVVEHVKSSPHCGYMRLVMGDRFIHIVLESVRHYGLPFNAIQEHLKNYVSWFTEKNVARRLKLETVNRSSTDFAQDYFNKMSPSDETFLACQCCLKGNSAIRLVSCREQLLCVCVDCANSGQLCECQLPMQDHSPEPLWICWYSC